MEDVRDEQEELHSGEALTDADAFPERERNQLFHFWQQLSSRVEEPLGFELLGLGEDALVGKDAGDLEGPPPGPL